ncbi:MarR family winged helix-turn-helix transcriptional regulator [Nocardioides sp.]|uniref:MarR family winged helix-turn-helix transcriptional regulator n=1 Tax=Nocardioides sp. TaxID=35761 RepID=UPI0035282077
MPPTDQGHDAASDLLMLAARSMRRAYADAMADYDVTPSQARALRTVADLGPVRLSVLAERLRIAPRSATEVVDDLEARGLVARGPDPDDRRATKVALTAAGEGLRDRLEGARRAASDQRLAALSAAERDQLAALLARLVERPAD